MSFSDSFASAASSDTICDTQQGRASASPAYSEATPFSPPVGIWSLTLAKHRRGRVQLIDATRHFVKMKKSLGNKRNELSSEQIYEITKIYSDFKHDAKCKVVDDGKEVDTVVAELLSFFQALKSGSLFGYLILLAVVLIGLALTIVAVAYQRVVIKRSQTASKATQ